MNSSYLLVNELRVHYLQWEADGAGKPCILLHGLASNARIWGKVAPLLAQAGLSPLALDQRGHGLTDKPEGDYGFGTFVRDLAAFVDAFDLQHPLLVGHSWGASVALEYAARFPAGPRAPAGIVLVDGGVIQMDDAPGAAWESTRRRLEPPALAGMPLESFVERLKDPGSKWQPDDEDIAIILANFNVDEQETIFPYLSHDHHMQIVRAMWNLKTYERFSHLRCPVLMVPARPAEPLGDGERQFLAQKEKGIAIARERIPGLQVRWMPDTIHDIPLQRPVELAALIVEFAEIL